MKSTQIQAQINRLLKQKMEAQDVEARARIKNIFGCVPKAFCAGDEEMWGMVARVYCRRSFGYKGDDLADHEWIALWHKYAPKISMDKMLQAVYDYASGG